MEAWIESMLSLSEVCEYEEEAEDPFEVLSLSPGGLLGRDIRLGWKRGAWLEACSFTESQDCR